MKAILIAVNWLLSFMAISSVDMDHSFLRGILFILAWFVGSSLLLRFAGRRGWMDAIIKRFKLDES